MNISSTTYNGITFYVGDEMVHEDETVKIDFLFRNNRGDVKVIYTVISNYSNNYSEYIELFFHKYLTSLSQKRNYTILNPKKDPCCINCDNNTL